MTTEHEQNKKVLVVSHFDADGLASIIVLKNFYKNVTYHIMNYRRPTIDERIDKLIHNNYVKQFDLIYITDLNFTKKQLDKIISQGVPIIYLDHHNAEEGVHNPSKNRYIVKEVCGAMLTKNYIENKFNVDLSHLNLYLKYIQDYDLWDHKYMLSKPLNYVFDMYRDRDEYIERFMNGMKDDNDLIREEQEFIFKRINDINNYWDNLVVYDLPMKDNFTAIMNTSFDMVNEMADKVFKDIEYSDIELVICVTSKTSCALRTRQRDNYNIGKVVSELGIGGGHPHAAGCVLDARLDDDKKLEVFAIIAEKFRKGLQRLNPNALALG